MKPLPNEMYVMHVALPLFQKWMGSAFLQMRGEPASVAF